MLGDAHTFRVLLPVGGNSLQNCHDAFKRVPVGLFVLNSVLITGVTVLALLALCSVAAFAFTFVQWKGRGIALTVILATLIAPSETIAIALPPYSPELNSVENVWQYRRANWLAISAFDTYEAIIDARCIAWNHFAADPKIATSITNRSWSTVR